ncbi:MAG: element excision factor XisH family protein [Nostoc sp.]|uniref:element excision factor XisH family protein n=1 Tax=Nostoc sp. TaxID=1180 RepID=UPI002FFC58B5
MGLAWIYRKVFKAFCFIADSDISEFHTALGQYLNYCQALEEQEADRVLYLAVPIQTYQDFFQLSFVQRTLHRYQVTAVFIYLNHICCMGARPCAPTAWSIYLKIAVS